MEGLQVHHIQPLRRLGDDTSENLITLCASCTKKSISNLEIVGDCVILCGIFSRISIKKDALENNVPNLSRLFLQRYQGSGAPKPMKVYV